MEETYSIFKKFSSLEQANELKDLLKENGIESLITDNIPPVDFTFSGNTLLNEFEVKVKQSDIKNAEKILERHAENLIDEIDADYYLFTFTNEELFDILLKQDEWNEIDYTLAQKILKQRGESVDKDLLKSLKNERLNDLSKPEKDQRHWIIAGYIFSLLGGFIGLIIGYSLWTSKKTLPNRQKVYTYSANDRTQGKYIFYIGLVVASTALILRLVKQL